MTSSALPAQGAAWLRVTIVLLVVVLTVSGCAARGAAPAITVENPFSRPSPSTGGNGGAFMTILNSSAISDRLVSVTSAASNVAELHETTEEDGVMKMRPMPEGFEIPAKGRLELKPGGKHVMLIGLTAPLIAGQEIEITLNFEKAGAIRVKVPVTQ
jgi:copper(I)-binding protein